jgi:HSP20 family protein
VCLQLEAHGDQLNISVDHTEFKDTEEGEGEERAHRIERCCMAMSRSVRLPPHAKLDSVQAAYKDGVLTLAVPKEADTAPDSKRITIA